MNTFSKRTTGSYAIMDGQYGSTGKGLLAGHLAETRQPTAIVSAYSPNAGHTYITSGGIKFVTTQVPIGAISPRARGIFIGPGAVIDPVKMEEEIEFLAQAGLLNLSTTEFIIHENAAICSPECARAEVDAGLAKIGSTLKGSMIANVRKLHRQTYDGLLPVARDSLRGALGCFVASGDEYQRKLEAYGYITQVEGAQGFSLSLNHGFYPYVTSRDVTPHQLFNDCAIPWGMAKATEIYQSLRVYPIRVNNREGSSGPGYPDQEEMQWSDIGIEPELTTVTKLPRRLFSWSRLQLEHMNRICGTPDGIFLNFVNYVDSPDYLARILTDIQDVCKRGGLVHWFGLGPAAGDVLEANGSAYSPKSGYAPQHAEVAELINKAMVLSKYRRERGE